MTSNIVYRGPADIRKLSKSDLSKAGVEDFRATAFKRDEPTEVSNEVSKALTENSKLFGKFEEAKDEDSGDAKLFEGEGIPDTGAAATGDTTTATATDTTQTRAGNGSSTRGSARTR